MAILDKTTSLMKFGFSRHSVLSILLLTFISLFIIPAGECGAIIYYVDAAMGQDTNTGLSPASAWKSISKVNRSVFAPGDRILFNRGGVWREQLTISSSGASGNAIIFGSYGTGNFPKILGSKQANDASEWGQSGDLWYISISSTPNIVWRDNIKMTKVSSQKSLDANNKWWCDSSNGLVWVYSSGAAPTSGGHTFEIAQRSNAINGVSDVDYITIDGLDCRYTNEWGINVNRGQTHWTVQNCNVSQAWYAGIHFEAANNASAIGNTVSYTGQVWNGTTDLQSGLVLDTVNTGLVRGNTVHHTGRSAIAVIGGCTNVTVEYNEVSYTGLTGDHGYGIQLYPYTLGVAQTNTIVRYNYCHDNGNIDLYILNRVVNPQVYYNIFNNPKINAPGSDWFANVVIDTTLSGDYCSGGHFYNNVCYLDSQPRNGFNIRVIVPDNARMESATFKNNIFWNLERGQQAMYCPRTHLIPPVFNNNCYWLENSPGTTIINYESTNYTLGGFRSIKNQELQGMENDPKFVTSGTDFHLQSISPCIRAGTNVGLTQDYQGSTVATPPCIGAFEVPTDPPAKKFAGCSLIRKGLSKGNPEYQGGP